MKKENNYLQIEGDIGNGDKIDSNTFEARIPISTCRKILKNQSLTDVQVLAIRDFLYLIGEIDYRYHEERVKSKSTIIKLKHSDNETESDIVCTREYRRAS